MKKIYRISVFNRTSGRRELLWNTYTSLAAAQKVAKEMNKVDQDWSVDAKVVVRKEK